MNLIILPVLPPIFPKTLLTRCAAPLNAGPADEVTLDRPCDAFDVTFEAESFALVAVLDTASAAWDVVEACRRAIRRVTRRVCLRNVRDTAVDMALVRGPRLYPIEVEEEKVGDKCSCGERAALGPLAKRNAFHWLPVQGSFFW